MVVVAIIIAMIVMVVPGVYYVFKLDQRAAAQKMATTLQLLRDEATLRNVTFRLSFHLDEKYMEIEVGDPNTLIFDNPDARLEYEAQHADKLTRGSKDPGEEGEDPSATTFSKLTDKFHKRMDLPSGLRFGGVYTPQYGEFVQPSGDDEVDSEDAKIVYSYVFANGFSEHTVIHLVDENDPESGFTIEIEPLSGRAHVSPELRDYDERLSFIPDEGPDLPN